MAIPRPATACLPIPPPTVPNLSKPMPTRRDHLPGNLAHPSSIFRRILAHVCIGLRHFAFAFACVFCTASFPVAIAGPQDEGSAKPAEAKRGRKPAKQVDARNTSTGKPDPPRDPELEKFGIYQKTAPRAEAAPPVATTLPMQLQQGDRIALIGNSLLERSQQFGHLEAMIQQAHPDLQLSVRHLAWSGDEVDLQPRPDNFADTFQHLTHERADVIFAAFGLNESFAGETGLDSFRDSLTNFLQQLKSKAFNGQSAARIVLVSPVANENLPDVRAADRNNQSLARYVEVMSEVAAEQQVGFADVFQPTRSTLASMGSDYTINGVHLNEAGDHLFSSLLFQNTFGHDPPPVKPALRAVIADKNRQFFRRFRPLNTFYYTGGRNQTYGYLDFLPAMRNFDQMVANRDQRIWEIASGQSDSTEIDDGNLAPMPETKQSRGANQWLTAEDERRAFQVDPRFEVNLFAGEEQFPEIANPIQMRWDSRGRLWVSCSTTYPHVYPGKEPNDKLVILEDTDGDGRADRSKVFADDLHVPLSFAFGDGGVYVSEQPNLSFLKDTDGDDVADVHRVVLSGFGTEDSHHSLHDFSWTPDGDLIFRESIFHHSQVETPYGPVRQQNSGWFRFEPRTGRLVSFGTYHSTNPWGVTFDDWGQHLASHPVYAEAFHSLDPPYPVQHPRPTGLQAYSGVCGHQMVDFSTFPEETQGGFIKVRYKPTNRVEIHRWIEGDYGYSEEYVGDLLFSTNLSFIPVDLQWGPRGALYVCDWYNPIKGHAQYSLRDPRRDRDSGRIWRITAKGQPLLDPPSIADASIDDLLSLLKRRETQIRQWAKRELRQRDPADVLPRLDQWVQALNADDARFRHHQMEAVWTYRWIGLVGLPSSVDPSSDPRPDRAIGGDLATDSDESLRIATSTLQDLLGCDEAHARAAATQQLRYWHPYLPQAIRLLNQSARDPNGIVRMQAVIAATYIGTREALEAILDVFQYPRDGHLQYAISCALGSRTLRPFWESEDRYGIATLLQQAAKDRTIKEPTPSASEAQFDSQQDLNVIKISCIPEKMLFSVDRIDARPGQSVKIVFTNPDATDHNLVLLRPGALAEVGMAANEMAKDPRNAKSDFIPREKSNLILHASPMIGPTRSSLIHVLRFKAPTEPGVYPYVCTFPGHWVVMNGVMVVAKNADTADRMLADHQPTVVREWTMKDFADFNADHPATDEDSLMQGAMAFVKARCNQCHVVGGHGVNLGPDLVASVKQLRGTELLRQMLEPSSKIHPDHQSYRFLLVDGRVVTGVIVEESNKAYRVATNLLTPNSLTNIRKRDVDVKIKSDVSPMPTGLLNVLTRDEIENLHAFLQAGGEIPGHSHHHEAAGGD
ncbi:hypothetical protein FYK55_25340 [Roseiconus nitratireducens]|uniref:Cytochrome c domain-containing protein n=1 Tax=Roseiconus nitratireducens TaxID=2605748 RepID=A0A5M6D1S4_9BACT|nr:PVC-type heme-binding CxxCH protein [Roseiconus nitratireducens]KAA5539065.1 hypothetical protein FYK55_25340 [Roseiconus nitratireducens]